MADVKDLDIEKIAKRLRDRTVTGKFFNELPKQVRTIASHATLLSRISIIKLLVADLDRELKAGGDINSWKQSITRDSLNSFVKARIETTYRTNVQTVYNHGFFERAQELKDDFPYMMYDAVDDSRTRPEHAALDGIIRRVDDAFWSTNFPPNGFNCRCGVVSLTEKQARQERESQDRSGIQTTKGELNKIKNTGVNESLSGISISGRNGAKVKGRPDKGFTKFDRKDISNNLLDSTEEQIKTLDKDIRKPFRDKLKNLEQKTERWYNRNSDKFS